LCVSLARRKKEIESLLQAIIQEIYQCGPITTRIAVTQSLEDKTCVIYCDNMKTQDEILEKNIFPKEDARFTGFFPKKPLQNYNLLQSN